MDKFTKKKTFYNQDILLILKEKYGFGYDYIRKAIAGERVGTVPLQMKEEYDKLEKEAKRAINLKKDNL